MAQDDKAKTGAERRRHPRLPLKLEVAQVHGSDRVTYRVVDMSLGGLYVEGLEGGQEGEEVILELRVPDGRTDQAVTILGWVVRADGTRGTAIRIMAVDRAGRARLREFLEDYSFFLEDG